MRVLVTGGAGFVGSHIVEHLLKGDEEVAVVDDLSTGRRENVPDGAEFFAVDVSSGRGLTEVFRRFRPEALCHQAAQTDLRRSVPCAGPREVTGRAPGSSRREKRSTPRPWSRRGQRRAPKTPR